MTTKNVIDEVKSLVAKRDQDIYEAYTMLDGVISRVKAILSDIDTTFSSWYDEILKLAEKIGATECSQENKHPKEPQQHSQCFSTRALRE